MWTPEKEAVLLYLKGLGLSGSQVADVLAAMFGGTYTRNMVIAKHRRLRRKGGWYSLDDSRKAEALRLAERFLKPAQVDEPKPEKKPRPQKPKKSKKPKPRGEAPVPEMEHEGISDILDLGPRSCRFILENGNWCGLEIVRGSYCAKHARIVYQEKEKC